MDSVKKQDYPDYLNPFDSDDGGGRGPFDDSDEESAPDTGKQAIRTSAEEYPDYLSPFGDEDNTGAVDESKAAADDYDDSLNPFGDESEKEPAKDASKQACNDAPIDTTADTVQTRISDPGEGGLSLSKERSGDKPPVPQKPASAAIIQSVTSQPEESLGPPPVPLPRTRSLLKKEQALRNKQPPNQPPAESDNHKAAAPSSISETQDDLSTTNATTTNTNNSSLINNNASSQQKKTKRNAPPLPVNYKRQVSGSAEAIEEELNQIGDRLAELELDSKGCQSDLKRSYQMNDTEFAIARAKFVEIIRIKNSILRRQKELMYKKREITLDQNHSDIEYELRMIGNKQSSNKTPEDDAREKELLKKLVEIVEEKNDIVENLNRDTPCDIEDAEEALRRMNLTSSPALNGGSHKLKPDETSSSEGGGGAKTNKQQTNAVVVDSCYKSNNSLVSGAKFSKIATLLPMSGTLKGTMKLKRKRLFKKKESSSEVPS